jgi:hypothetical protein
MNNKRPNALYVEKTQASDFQIVIRQRGAKPNSAATSPKPEKRDNIFSKSRDTREDRSARQMKTAHNPQTFSHTQ